MANHSGFWCCKTWWLWQYCKSNSVRRAKLQSLNNSNNNNTRMIFIVLSSWPLKVISRVHLVHLMNCRTAHKRPSTLRPSHLTWAVSPPVGSYHLLSPLSENQAKCPSCCQTNSIKAVNACWPRKFLVSPSTSFCLSWSQINWQHHRANEETVYMLQVLIVCRRWCWALHRCRHWGPLVLLLRSPSFCILVFALCSVIISDWFFSQ